ncbi:MAG: hypothetical protein KIT72_03360 [Polyangiaceae bacterium]|nr:hypothetical protein [Polyangiaceae bacterium]MCW5789438.1 hypothetical protein [Polyangiaceae bacterium]
MGGAAPLLLRAASPNGRWVALCQSREDTDGDGQVGFELGARGEPKGDSLTTYLVRGAGLGEPIQELLDADPTGRWLLFTAGGRVHLLDDHTGARVDLSALGADAREDTSRELPHRAFSFDAKGSTLAYLRQPPGARGGTEALVLRDLPTGREQTLAPGRGSVYRLRLSADARWLVLQVLIDDTNGNGRLDWPSPVLPLTPEGPRSRRCRAPVMSYSVHPHRGDTVFTRVIPLQFPSGNDSPHGAHHGKPPGDKAARHDARPQREDALITPFGDSLLVRGAGGELLQAWAAGARRAPRELAPAACRARLIHADPERGALVTTCDHSEDERKIQGTRQSVWLINTTPSTPIRTPLGFTLAPIHTDSEAAARPERLLAFYPGNETTLLDLDTGALHPLAVGDLVLSTFEARALVRRADELWLAEVRPAARVGEPPTKPRVEWTRLSLTVDRAAEQLHQRHLSWVSPYLIDLRRGVALATLDHLRDDEHRLDVLALTDDGRALIPSSVDARGLPVGPLSWH